VQCDCPNKRVLVVNADDGYSSASDFVDDTLALLAADHAGSEEYLEEHIDASDVDRYESLIVQRVLSPQMQKAEQKSATHIVPNKVCHQRVFVPHNH